ncbi:hypothetical protein D030_5187A, partial [Vibrio parahaemolyticus AQ3810]
MHPRNALGRYLYQY